MGPTEMRTQLERFVTGRNPAEVPASEFIDTLPKGVNAFVEKIRSAYRDTMAHTLIEELRVMKRTYERRTKRRSGESKPGRLDEIKPGTPEEE